MSTSLYRTSSTSLLVLLLLLLPACQSAGNENAEGAEKDEGGEVLQEASARSAAADAARVYFLAPADGATVSSPVSISFGIEGMSVVAAGTEQEFSGHHHLLVDVDELPSFEQPIPNDDNHRHFGGAQTETMLELSAGTHTLQLILGDHLHIPHDPALVSESITITVE